MLYECNTCHKPIDWDKEKRQALGTTRPLNPDGSIHTHTQYNHTPTSPSTSTTPTAQQPNNTSTPTPTPPPPTTTTTTPQQDDADKTRPSLVSLTQEETRILKDLAAYLQDIKKAKWSS